MVQFYVIGAHLSTPTFIHKQRNFRRHKLPSWSIITSSSENIWPQKAFLLANSLSSVYPWMSRCLCPLKWKDSEGVYFVQYFDRSKLRLEQISLIIRILKTYVLKIKRNISARNENLLMSKFMFWYSFFLFNRVPFTPFFIIIMKGDWSFQRTKFTIKVQLK